jgi:DNA-binding XRE family transcriptional regulator
MNSSMQHPISFVIPQNFGDRVRATRRDLSVTAAQLANTAGLSMNRLRAIEHGAVCTMDESRATATALSAWLAVRSARVSRLLSVPIP